MQRSLSEDSNWGQWWPGVVEDDRLIFNDKTYRITDHTFSSVLIEINPNNMPVKSSLTVSSLNRDSAWVSWAAEMYASNNPYTRLKTYLYALSIRKDISQALEAARIFFSLDIKRETVKNSSLIFTTDSSLGYPSTEKIYRMLESLRKYIVNNNALAVDSPMLNVHSNDNVYYITRVAIPTNKKLAPSGNIQYKWMLEGGNILSAEITGDRKKTDSALATVEQ